MPCYHISRSFYSVKGFPIELHIQRHSNYIQIKLVKSNLIGNKTICAFPLVLTLVVIYFLHNYSHLQDFWVVCVIGVAGVLIACLFLLHYNIIEESIMIIRAIQGIQYNNKNMLGKVVSQFIRSTNVIINEAITMNQVVSYLAILECESTQLTDRQQINLIFTKLMPRNDCLKFIYTHIHDFLNNKTLEQ